MVSWLVCVSRKGGKERREAGRQVGGRVGKRQTFLFDILYVAFEVLVNQAGMLGASTVWPL